MKSTNIEHEIADQRKLCRTALATVSHPHMGDLSTVAVLPMFVFGEASSD